MRLSGLDPDSAAATAAGATAGAAACWHWLGKGRCFMGGKCHFRHDPAHRTAPHYNSRQDKRGAAKSDAAAAPAAAGAEQYGGGGGAHRVHGE
eukprot:XP_001703660.1 predicted protein [Chlamydomonas reinhardtii]